VLGTFAEIRPYIWWPTPAGTGYGLIWRPSFGQGRGRVRYLVHPYILVHFMHFWTKITSVTV